MKAFHALLIFLTIGGAFASQAKAEVVISCREHIQGPDRLGLVLSDDLKSGKLIEIDINRDGDEGDHVLLSNEAVPELSSQKWSVFKEIGKSSGLAVPTAVLKMTASRAHDAYLAGVRFEGIMIQNNSTLSNYDHLSCMRLK